MKSFIVYIILPALFNVDTIGSIVTEKAVNLIVEIVVDNPLTGPAYEVGLLD